MVMRLLTSVDFHAFKAVGTKRVYLEVVDVFR